MQVPDVVLCGAQSRRGLFPTEVGICRIPSVNMNLNVSYSPIGCFWWVPLFVVFSLIQGMSDILTMESFTGPLSLPGRVSSDICVAGHAVAVSHIHLSYHHYWY